nr:PEP-CTERM/exosortase system-associated acyltransferase [Thiococcus pfennigii]
MAAPGHSGHSAHVIVRDRYFRFSCIADPIDLETAYRIRYQVYCLERGLLRKDDYPDGLERDEYDAVSLHVLATHRSGEPAGTARLVTHSPLGFPLMRHCRFAGAYEYLNDPAYPGHTHGAEVSRVAISKTFRVRAGDTVYGGLPRAEGTRRSAGDVLVAPRNTPEILVGLCRLIYQASKRRGVTHWMLAMERSVHVILTRIGLKFVPAGPEVDYHGPVRPYFTTVKRFEEELYKASPERFHYFVRDLEPDLVPDFVRSRDGVGPPEVASV